MFSLYGDKNDHNNKRFGISKLVTVDGYKGRVFVIDKYHSRDTYTYGRKAFEIVYTVRDIDSGETITAYPEDMQLYFDSVAKQGEIDRHKKNIDDSLDYYNDTMTLYKMFGDIEYKEKADLILELLKEYISEFKRGT